MSQFITILTVGFLDLLVKERGHFKTQCSGTRRPTCEFCNTTSSRLLLTTARRIVSDCFELSVMEITLWSKCDEDTTYWDTAILVEDFLSNPASTTTYLFTGKGSQLDPA